MLLGDAPWEKDGNAHLGCPGDALAILAQAMLTQALWVDLCSHLRPSLLYMDFIQFPQWSGNPRPPELRTFSIIPLKIRSFELNQKFLGFFKRSFCEGRELRRPKSNHVHPAFSCFSPFLNPPKKVMKIQGFPSPFKTSSPGTMPK